MSLICRCASGPRLAQALGLDVAVFSDRVSVGRTGQKLKIATLVLLFVTMGFVGVASADGSLHVLRLGTGGIGGTYFPIGSMIAQAVSAPRQPKGADHDASVPGLLAVAQISNGSLSNIKSMARGDLDAALVQADVAHWAYHGTGIFKQGPRHDQLRTIGHLYPESLHLVARLGSGINVVKDLRGKRVSLDELGSGTLHAAMFIIKYYGLTLDDIKPVYLKPTFAALAIADGKLDAFFIFAGYPIAAVSDLAGTSGARLVPIDSNVVDVSLAKHPHFERGTIPAWIYGAGIIPANTYKDSGETPTLTVGAQLLVNASLDETMVYQFTRSLWHTKTLTALRSGHVKGAAIEPKNALRGVTLPLHAGAERYYREIGLLHDSGGTR
jgi:uncharacterized protein